MRRAPWLLLAVCAQALAGPEGLGDLRAAHCTDDAKGLPDQSGRCRCECIPQPSGQSCAFVNRVDRSRGTDVRCPENPPPPAKTKKQ